MNRPSVDQHAFFKDHGWLVLRAVVSAGSLIPVTKAFDRLTQLPGSDPEVLCNEQGKSIWQVPCVCAHSNVLLEHIHHGLGAFVAHLLDARRIQLLQDTLIVKPAKVGAAVELHQDYAHIGFLEPPNAVSIRLSLTDSTMEHGCLYVIDRSHHWGLQGKLLIFSEGLQQGIAEQLPKELRACVTEDRIPLQLSPGDVSIHHCLTYHGSFENTGDAPVKTIVTHVFDGNCQLVPDRLPSNALRFFNTDSEGHLSTTSFPVLFDHSLLRRNP